MGRPQTLSTDCDASGALRWWGGPSSLQQILTLAPSCCPQAINWLRRQWSEGNNAVLADEQGMGKSASVLAFLRSLRVDFACPGPVLLVAPAASLPFWEGAPQGRAGHPRRGWCFVG